MTLKGLSVIFLPYIKSCVIFFFFLNTSSSSTLYFYPAIRVAFLILKGTFCDVSKMDFVEMGSLLACVL